jgi:hypothetical protein
MTSYPTWLLLVLAGLLILGACQTAPKPTDDAKAPPATRLPTEAPSAQAFLTAAVDQDETTSSEVTAIVTLPSGEATPTTPGSAVRPPKDGQGNADVLHVRAVQTSGSTGSEQGSTWTFYVTVEHPDAGWQDYADGWDVLTPDGTVLKPDPESPFTRLLLHPHETEQPFTRSQSGIVIPPDVTQVRVRAHDLVDGYGGREVIVDLSVPEGEGFAVQTKP